MKYKPSLLITGASGFTGQHACKQFLEAGFNVTAVTRKKSIAYGEIRTENCNLTNRDEVQNLIKNIKPQYLLHLAGQNHVGESWKDPITSLEVNSMATAYLLEALRQDHLSCKIVIVGSALQFDPANVSTLPHPYSLSKTLQVLLARSWANLYKMDIIIAKPSNLIGPGFSNGVCSIFAQKIVEMEKDQYNKVLEVNNILSQRDFLDVRDAVRAYEYLLTKGKSGEIYEIASGRSRTLEEIVNGFKSLSAIDFEIKSKLENISEQPTTIRPSKIMQIGWKPIIPLTTSLCDILNFYRELKSSN